jgi:hypothetical protein
MTDWQSSFAFTHSAAAFGGCFYTFGLEKKNMFHTTNIFSTEAQRSFDILYFFPLAVFGGKRCDTLFFDLF